ncbi:replication initiator protein [Peromfec virus RodF8_29]|uniref:Replication initiator protein n=1 Tax=Peromfec virus RodF8_29 TaxID=2929367 RepID=A0A976N243_9VIRU|nr:replication initiator protein [Peromfec virus RodF8_29]
MPCYNPQLAFPLDYLTRDGKQAYRFIRCDRGVPYDVKERIFVSHHKSEVLRIPCNKCIGCRLKYAREWATRCMFELQYHKDAWFVTLTYNDQHVPKSYYPDPSTGEAIPVMTLSRRDLQLLLKRLRRSHPDCNIRYYACGEYGPTTWRPHYHMILYGLPLDDLQVRSQQVDGQITAWESPTLSAVWSTRPFGNYSPLLDAIGDVQLAPVTWSTCAYTARYVIKKQLGEDGRNFYETYHLQPPFTAMSLKPAIGKQYLLDHPDIYDWDSVPLPVGDGVKDVYPPRYFDRLYDIDHPEEMAQIKEMRRFASEAAQQAQLRQTSLTYYDLLAQQERSQLRRQQKEFDI